MRPDAAARSKYECERQDSRRVPRFLAQRGLSFQATGSFRERRQKNARKLAAAPHLTEPQLLAHWTVGTILLSRSRQRFMNDILTHREVLHAINATKTGALFRPSHLVPAWNQVAMVAQDPRHPGRPCVIGANGAGIFVKPLKKWLQEHRDSNQIAARIMRPASQENLRALNDGIRNTLSGLQRLSDDGVHTPKHPKPFDGPTAQGEEDDIGLNLFVPWERVPASVEDPQDLQHGHATAGRRDNDRGGGLAWIVEVRARLQQILFQPAGGMRLAAEHQFYMFDANDNGTLEFSEFCKLVTSLYHNQLKERDQALVARTMETLWEDIPRAEPDVITKTEFQGCYASLVSRLNEAIDPQHDTLHITSGTFLVGLMEVAGCLAFERVKDLGESTTTAQVQGSILCYTATSFAAKAEAFGAEGVPMDLSFDLGPEKLVSGTH